MNAISWASDKPGESSLLLLPDADDLFWMYFSANFCSIEYMAVRNHIEFIRWFRALPPQNYVRSLILLNDFQQRMQ